MKTIFNLEKINKNQIEISHPFFFWNKIIIPLSTIKKTKMNNKLNIMSILTKDNQVYHFKRNIVFLAFSLESFFKNY